MSTQSYVFKEAGSGDKKAGEATQQQGTDGNSNPILRNVVRVGSVAVDEVVYGDTNYTPSQATLDVSSSGNNQIVSAPASGKIVVLSWSVTTDSAHQIKLQDGNSNVLDAVYAGANSGKVVADPNGMIGECASTTKLNVNLGGGNNTFAWVSYINT